MNDVVSPAQPDSGGELVSPLALSAGAMLRNAREAAGLHVAALAVSMKVPVKKLEALEADRLDLLPDAVFVRALASSVCRALKIDPGPVLQKLPQNSVPRLDTEERGINAPFHSPGQTTSLTIPDFFAKPAVLAVLALLIGVVVLVIFPENQKSEHTSDVVAVPAPAVVAPEPVADTKPAVDVPAAMPVVAPTPSPEVAAVQPTTPVADGSKPAPALLPTAKKLDTPSAAADVASVDVGATGLVVFKVRGASWVEVTDAKGVVQLRKTLASGETAGASGALPLSVVIGRADVTDVEVRGKAFSLASIVKDNVARFEVK